MSALPAEYPEQKLPKAKRIKARTPSNVLNMRGTGSRSEQKHARGASPDKNPGKLEPLGPPPAHLNAAELEAWKEVVRLACKGVLCENDRIVVECLACLLVEARAKRWLLPGTQAQRLERCLAFLGMTPAHRSHVKVVFDDEPANPYA